MEKNVKKNKEEFFLNKSNLIENGALREIYQGQRATVYSLADSCYGIVILTDKPKEGNNYYLLHCSLEDIKAYITNENILFKMFKHKIEVTGEVFYFDDIYDEGLERLNIRRIEEGFTRIDLSKEEEMLSSFGFKK